MYDPASQAAAKGALGRLAWALFGLVIGLAVVVVAFAGCGGWAL